jgi:membrane protein YqaA with SNARE-associated domain
MLLSILWNSFSAGIVLMFRTEQFLYALAVFGKPLVLPLIVSVIGATLAQFVYYQFGMYLRTVWKRYPYFPDEEQYGQMETVMHRYGKWALVIFTFPVYPIMPILAGFFRLPLRFALTFFILAMAAQRLWTIHTLLGMLAKANGG